VNKRITAILLAAGLSRRMGKINKLLIDFNESTLLLTAVNEIHNSNIGKLIVVVGYEAEQIIPSLPKDIKYVMNTSFENGQTSSIQTGLAEIGYGDSFMICLADMPKLKSNHINQLISFFENIEHSNPIVRPYNNDIPGHPVIFHHSYKDQLLQCVEHDGCKSIIQSNIDKLCKYRTNDNAYFTDIDTHKDLETLVE